jgi:hypothetical protein
MRLAIVTALGGSPACNTPPPNGDAHTNAPTDSAATWDAAREVEERLDARTGTDADGPRDADRAYDDADDTDTGMDASADASADTGADAGATVRIPSEITAEAVFEAPAGATTPPTWNAHLPKLVGDARFLYVAFTHYPEAVSARYAAVLRRARGGGPWTEVARFASVHQPIGIAMTRAGALHVALGCLRASAGADVECFRGGAGTLGLRNRFYRLVFSARDATGALRWDTYANHGEWTGEANGYAGIAVAPDDAVHWSLLDATMNRPVFRAALGAGTRVATLSEPGRTLLYPLSAWDGDRPLVFVGEFDPSGGSNAGYPAASLYALDAASPTRALRIAPEVPVGPGMIGAFPSDLEATSDATVFALAYQRRAGGACTALFRGQIGRPFASLPVGCLDTYAKLQLVDDHTLVLVASAPGAAVRVGVSSDRGDTWRWTDVSLRGTHPDDREFFGYTLVDPRSAPGLFTPDRVRMVFSGYDAARTARRLYYAEWPLQ